MKEEGKEVFTPPPKIHKKIRAIRSDLEQAEEVGVLTAPQLIELLHRQTRELARVYHQLSHLHSGKEGNN